MKTPWTKRNPLMSMWLSAASSIANKVRGRATLQAKRDVTAATTKTVKQIADAWTAPAVRAAPVTRTTPAAKKRRRKRR